MTQETAPVRIEITEDATSGISIRLHNNGRFPDLLAGFPKDVVRRARPLVWTSYERRVMQKARTLSWQGRKLVRQMLIAERARALMTRDLQPKRAGWIAQRMAARAAGREGASRAAAVLPQHRVTAQVHEPRVSQPRPQTEARDLPVERSGPPAPRDYGHVEGVRPGADLSLAEQIVRGLQPVSPTHHDQDRDEQAGSPSLHQELVRLDKLGLLPDQPAPEQSLAEQMLSSTALRGVRAQPTGREDGQERSR